MKTYFGFKIPTIILGLTSNDRMKKACSILSCVKISCCDCLFNHENPKAILKFEKFEKKVNKK